MNGADATQKLTVRAKYSDGTDRDVTSLAYFMTNNDTSAEVSQDGVVTAGERGEAFLMARFETHTVGSHFIVLPKDFQFQWPNVPENNYVDTLINNKLKKLRIVPSELCSDEEFLRRAYVDIIGVLPTVEEYNRFMKNAASNKREQLVDELLNRKEFVELWVMKWAELLQIRTVNNRVSYKSMLRYYNWLQERVQNNVPMDKMVQELLAANGRNLRQCRHELLPGGAGHAQDLRKRGPGLHGHADSMRPMPQSSLRPLDDGRLLQLRGVLLPNRTKTWRRPPRVDHLQPRFRRCQTSGRQSRDGSKVPRGSGTPM